MPNNSQFNPSDEPGKRSGEGSGSILRHLQRQAKGQPQAPAGKVSEDQSENPAPERDHSNQ